MDGVLLIDKPSGPTSHDVVAALRRSSGERAIGHTGTLDPAATGLLPLVLGRATRLARYLSGGDKTYEATIRLGFPTDTDDATGQPIGEPSVGRPANDDITAALVSFRGTFSQVPPQHSAKRVAGRKAYELARRSTPVALTPVDVTVRDLVLLERDGDELRLRVSATAGFYVRALARDLGARLGCGAHLAALRRTRSGSLRVEDAVPFGEALELGPRVAERLLPAADALPDAPAVHVTEGGLRRARHGNFLMPEHLTGLPPLHTAPGPVRVLDGEGRLVALAEPRGSSLHPVVVLG